MPTKNDDDDIYPRITKAQHALLKALTDQRCTNFIEASDFIADLSDEAKTFLKGADKDKIEQINNTLKFMNAAGIISRFLWISGATAFGVFISVTQGWKAITDLIKK